MVNAPQISQELVDWLEYVFPNKLPTSAKDVDLSKLIGQQEVIRRIKMERISQQRST